MGFGLNARLLATLLGGCVCSAATAQGSAPAGQPPVEDFARGPDFSQVTLSPDGQYLAALMPAPGKPYENLLAILDGQTAKVLHVIPSGSAGLIASYFWVNDNRLVATMAVQHGGLDTPSLTGELFAIDADGSHPIDLFGYRARHANKWDDFSLIQTIERRDAFATPISTQPVNEDHILIAVNDLTRDPEGSFTGIERLDVRDGRTIGLGASPVRNARLIADHAGQVRVAVASADFAHYAMWTRASNSAPWILANDPAQSHLGIVPIGFNRDNSRLYVRVARGDKPDAIELMDMASRQLTLLFQGQFANPGDLLPTADRQDYYAVVDMDGKPSLYYFDGNAPEARLSKALSADFPGELALFSGFSRDGRRAIVRVSSDRNPGSFYLFDLGSRSARHLMDAEPWIDPQRMRPMQPITLSTRDDLTLHGFLTLPAGDRPYPLIVLPHGGPVGVADTWGYDPEVQLFASRGYAVLQVNYRGSGGYGSHFQQLGYRQWGLSMQDDLTDATRWAIRQGYADPRRICIYGASYGGYAALEGAVREPDLYRCAIGYDGVYDLRVQLANSDTEQTDRGAAYLHLALGDDPADLLRRSPLSGVPRIRANVLLLHGADDPRVPFKNFQEFTAALARDGKHYETLVEPHEGHGFFLAGHRLEAYRTILDFLDRNIGAAGNAAH